MSWLEDIMRPDLRDFAAYSSARTEAGDFSATLSLDANESPWPPFGSRAAESVSHRYPEPQPQDLRQRLAAIYDIKPEQLLLGRGSDEGIDLLTRLFCRAGEDEILVCPPTYGMYEVCARTQGAGIVKVPLLPEEGWQLNVPGILAACSSRTKLIFIPSPSAPMGHIMRKEDILHLCRAREGRGLVVVDEAYIEFSGAPEGLAPNLSRLPNLTVLRTLSKAHALAGERIGTILGEPNLIQALQKIQAPYPLTQSSIRVALDALSPIGLIEGQERRRLLVAERDRMASLLPQSSFVNSAYTSEANFLLLKANDAKGLLASLQKLGIRIRDRSNDIPDTVRITIGSPQENDTILRALGIDLPNDIQSKPTRKYSLRRKTTESQIDLTVNLDEPDLLDVKTGIGFFDHMLAQLAAHGGFGFALVCNGDLDVDQHHTIEDCALALGDALRQALGGKKGIGRYGFTAPLDESVAEVALDLSGRPYCELEGTFPSEKVGEMDVGMVPHFFRSLAAALGAALHITVRGDNTHHKVEACFKAVGRALRQAFRQEGNAVPSTKGVL